MKPNRFRARHCGNIVLTSAASTRLYQRHILYIVR